MPNWCQCSLRVLGRTPEALADFLEKNKNGENDLDFQQSIPCPQELLNTTSSHVFSLDEETDEKEMRRLCVANNWNWTEQQLQERIDAEKIIIRKFKSNLDKYGYKDWYDWKIDHWGTKWEIEAKAKEGDEENEVVFNFSTAWSPPLEWLRRVALLFPDVKFSMTYREEGNGFEGKTYAFRDEFEDESRDILFENSRYSDDYWES